MKKKMNFSTLKQTAKRWWSAHKEYLLATLSDALKVFGNLCGLWIYAFVISAGLTWGFFFIITLMQR